MTKSLCWMGKALATNRWMAKITFLPSFDHTNNSSNTSLAYGQRTWLNIVNANKKKHISYIFHAISKSKAWEFSVRELTAEIKHFWSRFSCALEKNERLIPLHLPFASVPNIFTDFLHHSLCGHLPPMLAVLQSEKPQNRLISYTAEANLPTRGQFNIFQENFKIWLLSLEQQDESWFLRRRIFLGICKTW